MIDAQAVLHTAIIAALKADAGVASIVADRVYDRAPTAVGGQAKATFPYVTLGRFDSQDILASCPAGVEIDAQVNGWSRAVGTVEAKRLGGALSACLTTPFTIEGFSIVTIRLLGLLTQDGLDGATSETKARLRYTLKPSG